MNKFASAVVAGFLLPSPGVAAQGAAAAPVKGTVAVAVPARAGVVNGKTREFRRLHLAPVH